MPITLPETLPAYAQLRREGVMVMSENRAARQDIRPLHIGLLNLMPKKIQTETQFARLIGATPLQINLFSNFACESKYRFITADSQDFVAVNRKRLVFRKTGIDGQNRTAMKYC